MNQKRIQEILDMFPAQKPVTFNYAVGRAAVLELINTLLNYENAPQEKCGDA